ncbi:MAG TPA: FCD domain-containing protein [Paraburkholderia sp.]|jgi:GntR family transcriptional repressor for pyruvate dehydrogenase complex|nr:FCD domain-containing protein [Paraburkholderia sp.]
MSTHSIDTTQISRPATLTQQVAQQIANDILNGVYPLGSRLPSGKDLALRFGVSQAVIREVTERLRAQGLIDSRQGSGSTVRARTLNTGFKVPEEYEANREELANVFELRLDLEGAAAALAAVRRTRADLDALKTILDTLAQNIYSPDRAVELDIAFHVAVGDATHNPYFKDLLHYLNLQIRESVRAGRSHSLAYPDLPDVVHHEHVRLFEAIEAGDAVAARAAAMSHLSEAAARLGLSMPGRDAHGEILAKS